VFHRLEHVERFTGAALADHDAVGRMRRQFFTRSRIVTCRGPSMFGGARLHREHVLLVELELLGILDGDDALVSGMNDDSTLRVVVLPVPVPPETTTLRRPTTHAWRNRAACAFSVPNRIRSSIWNGSLENFRMVRNGPPMAKRGGSPR